MAAKKKKKKAGRKHHAAHAMTTRSSNQPAKRTKRRASRAGNPPTKARRSPRRRNGADDLMSKAIPVAKGAAGVAAAIVAIELAKKVPQVAAHAKAASFLVPLALGALLWKFGKQKEMALGAASAAVLPAMTTVLKAITPGAEAAGYYGAENPPASLRALQLIANPVPVNFNRAVA